MKMYLNSQYHMGPPDDRTHLGCSATTVPTRPGRDPRTARAVSDWNRLLLDGHRNVLIPAWLRGWRGLAAVRRWRRWRSVRRLVTCGGLLCGRLLCVVRLLED